MRCAGIRTSLNIFNCGMDVRSSSFVIPYPKSPPHLNIFNCGMDVRSSSFVIPYPKNPPNCARCSWRARVPVKWHLADLRFRFLARQIDLKSWIHVI